MDPIVHTTCGALRGALDGELQVFRGIPFAAPPVGPRRFAVPAPVEPWRGERSALAFSPGPPQPGDGLSQMLGLLGEHSFAEDCLTLNVWAPARPAGPQPVLVWLHGGAFQTGASAGPAYEGARLARRGGVVVVTLNYRVGALGFLHLGASGPSNLGLRDQIAALAWVRREIASFGGDPEQVTVFGESAGAGSIAAEEAAARTGVFLSKLGLVSPDPDELRKVSVERILAAQAEVAEPGPRRIGMFFAPVVDGESLPCTPLQAVRAGAAAHTALVVGTTAEEMRLYALAPGFGELEEAQLRRSLAQRLPGDADRRDRAAEALLAAYADAGPAARDRFFALETDWHLWLPSVRMAEAQSAVQPKTFMYRFTWRSPLQGGVLGACHALDVPFTLGNLGGGRLRTFAGEGPAAERLAGQVMDAWLAFARSGDPSHPGIGQWVPYQPPRRATMELGARTGVLEAPQEARRALWERSLATP
jgi:para-nitrobenzyl esterase